MTRILIVDDSATQRVILKAIILNYFKNGGSDCEVTECSDGAQAMKALEGSQYSLVFSDINMEPVSGIDLLIKSKEKVGEIPFVFVSSHLTSTMQEKAVELGAKHYVTKPLLQEKIEPILKEFF